MGIGWMDGWAMLAAFADVVYILRSNTAKLAFCVIFKNLSDVLWGRIKRLQMI